MLIVLGQEKGSYKENDIKRYVTVVERRYDDGKITPLSIEWEWGKVFQVERIMDVRSAPSLKGGGQGLRYTVVINGKETCLWLEDGVRWFVERK